ncbi:MAG: Two-component transcriptional regulator, winged helix family protein [uncultured bacterium]|nr:MAG: Two-component transcriptional regulator, winged helix family protein [uncultured bacterium]KKT77121.1 MAG: Two-component transcriptional regulator, winged helix family protein [Candidatus Peregrinibacteria bacterium GW2011_GWA2_44_7]
MHVLILNHSPLQARFLQKAFRYENIGADLCRPENLNNMWYGQYEALLVPIQDWEHPPFHQLEKMILPLGQVPVLFTGKFHPPSPIREKLSEEGRRIFIGSHEPFQLIVQTIKNWGLQSSYSEEKRQIQWGDLELNLKAREVKRGTQFIRLKNKEFALLECLMRHPGEVLTRTFILEKVWDQNTNILSNTVDVHISRLRKKMDTRFERKMILTIPCVGYKLST